MRFMVTIDIVIPDAEREPAMALVPREKAHVATLLERGVVEAFHSRDDRAQATLVEIQDRLAALALRNAVDNGFAARVIVRHGDLAENLSIGEGGGRYEVAVANPPYRLLEEGPASPDQEVAIAQHE